MMLLQLNNVVKTYLEPGGKRLPVLFVKSFNMQPGEQLALVGSSGGGKSTLLNVIAGITAPDSGNVCINNIDITKISEQGRDVFRSGRIGYVFQTFQLLPAFTALENVLLGMSFSGAKVDRLHAVELLKRVGLSHRLHHRPGQLSVGEQQRVSVARALAKRPQILLADEPTANVDPANQQSILELLQAGCKEHQAGLLLVTHAVEVANQFQRVEQLANFNHPQELT